MVKIFDRIHRHWISAKRSVGNTLTLVYDTTGVVSDSLTIRYDFDLGKGTGKAQEIEPLPSFSPEPKHKVLNRYQVVMEAQVNCPCTHEFMLEGRMKAFYQGKLIANSKSLLKRIRIGKLDGSISSPLKHEFELQGSLSDKLIIGKVNGKLNFRPVKEFVKFNLRQLQGKIESFSFNEDAIGKGDAPKLDAFTHSSSFVGNVRYDREEQEMEIILNGKRYQYCGVPQRTFDGFKGADSKGRFYNRFIKNQFNC